MKITQELSKLVAQRTLLNHRINTRNMIKMPVGQLKLELNWVEQQIELFNEILSGDLYLLEDKRFKIAQ